MVTAQRTLRVGFLIDRWQPSRGGAERALAELARHLEARGHEVHAFSARGPSRGEGAPGRLHLVRTRRIALSRGARERQLSDAFLAAADGQRCDVTIGVRHLSRVDLYWPHGGSHARSVAAWRAARSWRVGGSQAIEPVALHGRHRAFAAFEHQLLDEGGARRVVCVSDLVASELGEDFPAARDRLVIAPNGIDLERFHPRARAASGAELRRQLDIDAQAIVLAFAARQPVLKGLPVLLAALSRLERMPWTLIVAGSPDIGAWQRRARAAGLESSRVRIVRDIDSATLFAGSDLCVLPTWRDTSGLVILEALACGTPVITTACAGEGATIEGQAGDVLGRTGDVDALEVVLEKWIERTRRGSVDRDAVRVCVADRGREAWLGRLEDNLLDLAR